MRKHFKPFIQHILSHALPARLQSELYLEWRAFLEKLGSGLFPSRRKTIVESRRLRNLQVNLGCGNLKREGWCGIDLFSEKADLRWDVRRGLPLADSSCKIIFSEHVVEHLSLDELRTLLTDCFRVLAPGGAIRLVTPDLARFTRAYLEKDASFLKNVWSPQDASYCEMLNGLFYMQGHRYLHDLDSLMKELQNAGFKNVTGSEYGKSLFAELAIESSMKHRRLESLYVEAVKS